MKKIFIFCFLLFFLMVPALVAGPIVDCDVKKISQHELLVTFSWEVTVQSDKDWDVCDLTISFHDGEGHEIYAVFDRLEIKIGSNYFSGHEICSTKTWNRIEKYLTTLDCVF